MEPNDLVLWVENRRALVAADTLIDCGHGLEFPADWANKGVPPDSTGAGSATSCERRALERRHADARQRDPASTAWQAI